MGVAIAAGVAWGVFCAVANGWHVGSTLAQMAVPWIWVAAFVAHHAARTTRQAALLGGVTLLAANFAYFAIGSLALSSSGLPLGGGARFLALWTSAGLLVGPIAGMAGFWLKVESAELMAVVALATVSVAEPLALWAHIDHFDARVAYVGAAMAGAAFATIRFHRAKRNIRKAVASMLVLIYPTAVALEATLIALRQISAPMRLV